MKKPDIKQEAKDALGRHKARGNMKVIIAVALVLAFIALAVIFGG